MGAGAYGVRNAPWPSVTRALAGLPLDTGQIRADNAPMGGKSRRERVASMSHAERPGDMPGTISFVEKI